MNTADIIAASKPGDILFWNRIDHPILDGMIAKIDGVPVNHTTELLNGTDCISAEASGVIIQSIADLVSHSDKCVIRRPIASVDIAQTIKIAYDMVSEKHPYAYGELAALAIIDHMRNSNGHYQSFMNSMAARIQSRQHTPKPMMCSESIYLIYQRCNITIPVPTWRTLNLTINPQIGFSGFVTPADLLVTTMFTTTAEF